MRFFLFLLFLTKTFQSNASIFDAVKSQKNSLARVNLADSLYQNYFRNNDSTLVLQSLKELRIIADNLDDNLLRCYTLSTLGDYYARIRYFNGLSTFYLIQAIQLAKECNSKVAETISNYKLGRYYYNFKKYPLAFEYLLRANYMAKEIGYSKELQAGWILFYLAKAYQEIGDVDNAAMYYKACLPYNTENNKFRIIQSYSSMASIAKDKQDFTHAEIKRKAHTWMYMACMCVCMYAYIHACHQI
jgi:hypothetical protein